MTTHIKVETLNNCIKVLDEHIEIGGPNVLYPSKVSRQGQLMMDGVPVNRHMHDFAEALRKAMPGVKFGHDDALRGSSVVGMSELAVYYPGQEYALGYIGHGDYSLTGSNCVYIVYSRKVANGKIRPGQRQHYMLQSESLDKAVKNAKRALLPYTNEEVANLSITDFGTHVRDLVEEADGEARAYVRKCRDEDVLAKELRNLISLGVQFVTPEFQAAATQFLTAEAEARDKKAHLQGAYFIRMYERFDGMYADVLTYDRKVKDASRWSTIKPSPTESVTLKAEDIPEDVQMKIATLSMMDAETYVPLVGYKASATTFWIERSAA
jgi:hypothetical protein